MYDPDCLTYGPDCLISLALTVLLCRVCTTSALLPPCPPSRGPSRSTHTHAHTRARVPLSFVSRAPGRVVLLGRTRHSPVWFSVWATSVLAFTACYDPVWFSFIDCNHYQSLLQKNDCSHYQTGVCTRTAISRSLSDNLSLSLSRTISHPFFWTISRTLFQTISDSLSLSRTICLTLTRTVSHSFSHTIYHTLTWTNSLTLSRTISPALLQPPPLG